MANALGGGGGAGGACRGAFDANVTGFHGACVLLLLAREGHMQQGNLQVQCVRIVHVDAAHPVRIQIQAAILPHYPKMRVGVARKRKTVLTPGGPHILEVSANVLCDDIDSLTNTGDDGRCVAMHRIKLELGPVGGVEEGGVDSSLEDE